MNRLKRTNLGDIIKLTAKLADVFPNLDVKGRYRITADGRIASVHKTGTKYLNPRIINGLKTRSYTVILNDGSYKCITVPQVLDIRKSYEYSSKFAMDSNSDIPQKQPQQQLNLPIAITEQQIEEVLDVVFLEDKKPKFLITETSIKSSGSWYKKLFLKPKYFTIKLKDNITGQLHKKDSEFELLTIEGIKSFFNLNNGEFTLEIIKVY